MESHCNNPKGSEKSHHKTNATRSTIRICRVKKPNMATERSADKINSHPNVSTEVVNSSTDYTQNGRKKEQGSTRIFSARNSLRFAQSLRNQSQTNIITKAIPKGESKMAGTYYDAVELQKGIGETTRYRPIHSETFTSIIQSELICLLCGIRQPVRPNDADYKFNDHIQSIDHNEKFCELRTKLSYELPDESSIQIKAIQELLCHWHSECYLSEEDISLRDQVRLEFEEILRLISPDSYCRVTGSLLQNTSLKSSDINLELVHPNSHIFSLDPRAKNSIHHELVEDELGLQLNRHVIYYDLAPNPVNTLYVIMKHLRSKAECLGRHSVSFQVKSTLDCLNSKIPRLILKHSPTNITLEIKPSIGSSFRLSNLLNSYMALDYRASVLASLVKYWAKLCQIDNPSAGTLHPEAYVILVIFYLQRTSPPILPCIHELLYKNFKSNNNQIDHQTKPNSGSSLRETYGRSNHDKSHQVEQNDNANEEDDLDYSEEASSEYNDVDLYNLKDINWNTENTTSIPILFIDFMKTMIKEFNNLQDVITIRTLKAKVSKKACNQVKCIENPVDPNLDLSRLIGTTRTFNFIRDCFENTYHYLTSIPVDRRLKVRESRSDPKDYVELYLDFSRIDSYFEMRRGTLKRKSTYNAVDEMISQKLFAKDVEVVNALFDSAKHSGGQNTLPGMLARLFDPKLLAPRDKYPLKHCFTCRQFGHLKTNCSEYRIITLHREVSSRDPDLDNRASFDSIFERMYEQDIITEDMQENFVKALKKLANIIEAYLGMRCYLQPFGSVFNGLGSRDSDLDVSLSLKGNRTGEGVDCVDILSKVHDAIRDYQPEEPIEAILTARVPILKFRFESIDIDLCMYNRCAIYNSYMLKSYALIDERFPKLYYLVKRHAKACGVADASKGTLSSYAWSLMVIHFLQRTQPPILPVLQESFKGKKKPVIGVCGWNVWFNDKSTFVGENMETNLTTLFKDFLLYYGTFNFSINVISIRRLAPINRFEKNWYNNMIAIEDPFELTYNLALRLNDQMSIYIINSIAQAYHNIVELQESHIRSGRSIMNLAPRVFKGKQITGRSKPPYRGCRLCHCIGHKVADCPMKGKDVSNTARLRDEG